MKKIALLIIAILAPLASLAKESPSPQNPAMVVHLLDYLAKDYGRAVKDGKVTSESEYQEQLEFAAIVSRSAKELPAFRSSEDFNNAVLQLIDEIKSKSSSEVVSKLARNLQTQAVKLANIQLSPTHWPDLSMGAKIFSQHCATCHGTTGKGDGPAGVGLDPAPANFQDSDTKAASSPFQYYNTIRLGVPGTGMAAFSDLSDEQVWSAAFYVKSLGYSGAKHDLAEIPLKLNEVSSATDQQILLSLTGDADRRKETLEAIRTYQPSFGTYHFLSVTEALLKNSQTAYRSGNYKSAIDFSLKAYLDGIEPLEPKIKANRPELVIRIEGELTQYRTLLKRSESTPILDENLKQIQQTISEIRDSLQEKKMSPAVAFGAAFSIFLREGFEAVLIIIVLLSIIKAMGVQQAGKWVHLGWLLALGVGLVTWFASGAVLKISGYSREMLEGIISIFAVVVLLYVGFWLHKHSEVKKWQDFLQSKVQSALDNKKLIGLMFVSFIAVFREAFEVVLFLRAIWFDLDTTGKTSASFGVVLSFVSIIGLSYFVIRSSKKLPIALLFNICSVAMVILALILVGKGIHAFQETGGLAINLFPVNLRSDFLGIYPTWETLCGQAVIICFVLLLRAKTLVYK